MCRGENYYCSGLSCDINANLGSIMTRYLYSDNDDNCCIPEKFDEATGTKGSGSYNAHIKLKMVDSFHYRNSANLTLSLEQQYNSNNKNNTSNDEIKYLRRDDELGNFEDTKGYVKEMYIKEICETSYPDRNRRYNNKVNYFEIAI